MQIIAGILGCLILLMLSYGAFAVAYFYGVLLMIVNAWLLARKLNQANELSVEAIQRSIYAGAAIRFVIVIAGLLLGHLLDLHLMVVAVGMFAAQVLVYMLALIDLQKESR